MVAVMGTSTCHLVLGSRPAVVEGMCGVVEDGILPGQFGYEAGQSGVGDIFAWFVDHGVPPAYHAAAREQGIDVHHVLEREAARLRPGESGLVALDWWNGNRSILVDADLSGLVVGATLATRAPDIYRALIEATAFGTRMIIDAFEDAGVAIDEVVACGGLPERNRLLMQIYADVTEREFKVAASAQTPALGSAMFGAVAAGSARGGYDDIADATAAMARIKDESYRPDPTNRAVYDELYDEYRRLHDTFGRGENDVMKRLRGPSASGRSPTGGHERSRVGRPTSSRRRPLLRCARDIRRRPRVLAGQDLGRRAPPQRAADARHRRDGQGLAEHRLPGPQRRTDPRPDRRGDPGARDPGRPRAGLPAEPACPRAAWRRTMLLGAVVRDITDPFFAGAVEALSVEAMAHGYNVVLGHAHGRADEAIALTMVLETRHCDAIILLGDMQNQPRLLDDLKDSIVPVVALWQGTSPLDVPTVDVDNRLGIRAGLDHLAGLGHERIAFVSGRPLGDVRERRAAFEEYMRQRFGGLDDRYVREVANTPAGGEEALRALLALDRPPTAVVTSTDTLAVGVLHAAYMTGRTVPADLSVVGFDDILLASHTVPALTTLRMPLTEIVRAGVAMAVDLAKNGRSPGVQTVEIIAPSLIVRQSTAAPPERLLELGQPRARGSGSTTPGSSGARRGTPASWWPRRSSRARRRRSRRSRPGRPCRATS